MDPVLVRVVFLGYDPFVSVDYLLDAMGSKLVRGVGVGFKRPGFSFEPTHLFFESGAFSFEE